MLLNEKLKKYRKEHKLTQQKFAEDLGISRQYYSNLELGSVQGNMRIFKALDKATDLKFSYWSDVETESSYKSYEALDILIDSLIDSGKINKETGDIDPAVIPAIMKILKSEIIIKIRK